MNKALIGHKRKRRPKKTPHFDISGLKKLIKNELYNSNSPNEVNRLSNKNQIMTIFEEDKSYYYKYIKYMSEEFNSQLVGMIVSYINKNKLMPLKYQKEANFLYKFINLLKHLLMNEFEIAYFTLLLDKIGWKWLNVDHWTYFCILGIFTKKFCGREEDSSLLISIISRNNPEFTDIYTNWACDEDISNKIENEAIDIKLINERFRVLNRCFNSYCRKNFINYNGIADKITKMSQPYGEGSNANKLEDNEQFNSNNGIIENNELKFLTPSYVPQNDYICLRNNLSMKPMISDSLSQKCKKLEYYNPNNNRLVLEEISPNKQSNLNLNLSLYNKRSSFLFSRVDSLSNF